MPEAALALPDDIVGWIEDETGGKVTAPDCPIRSEPSIRYGVGFASCLWAGSGSSN